MSFTFLATKSDTLDYYCYLSHQIEALLLTMGTMGVFRGKPIVSIFVNESRYTYELLQKNPYFTLAVFPEQYKESVDYLGHHSGRDGADKIKDAGLEVSKTALGNPFFEQASLVIEGVILYTGTWDESKLDDFYAQTFKICKICHNIYKLNDETVFNAWCFGI